MKKFPNNRKLFLFSFVGFVLCNFLVYFWMVKFHAVIPFSTREYTHAANHYIADPRISGGTLSLVNALGQYDSQWYLKIAEKGYPYKPVLQKEEDLTIMEGLLYNFFPFYPILISGVNVLIQNIELSAFILSLILLTSTFVSHYYVVSQWFSEKVAVKATLLLMVYPFSIFLRGYYSEGLRLLLFIWLCYFITKKHFLLASVFIGLLCVTSGISVLLLPLFLCIVLVQVNTKELHWGKSIISACIALLPFILWMLFCYFQTGDPFYFFKTRFAWERGYDIPILHNIGLLFSYPWLPLRAFYGSQIDVLIIFLVISLAFLSRKVLPKLVWLMTCIIAFTPLFIQDSVSYARFSIVLFPLFVYLSVVMNKKLYGITFVIFSAGLLLVSLYFINWYWIE